MITNTYNSDLAIHPGEFLEETLGAVGMTQAELSNRLGMPVQTINEIIKGKKSITSTTALELEYVLDVPSHIWLGLENQYQIVLAKQKELECMKMEIKLVSKFSYADLVKNEFVKATRKPIERVNELKRFFEVKKLAQIPQVKAYQPAFRVSSGDISHEVIASWLQAARIKAKDIEVKVFDKKRLEEKLLEIKSLMTLEYISEAVKEIQKVLNSCGIALVLLPHFKKTKIHGATFWLDNKKAVIAMTLKGSFSDLFWFSFFHEVGHILLHPKREVFLEDGCIDPKLQKQEDEANKFAKDLLINDDDFNKFISFGISKAGVIEFAKQQGVKPSIVVGRLMHKNIINYNDYQLSPLRDRYKWT
jgi:HTH-type transcriptional regulator/antitoxin HigA